MSCINDLYVLSKIRFIHELLEYYGNVEAASNELCLLYDSLKEDIHE